MPSVHSLIIINYKVETSIRIRTAEILIFRVMVVCSFYSNFKTKRCLIIKTGILKPCPVVGESTAKNAASIQLIDVSVVIAALIRERYIVIVCKIIFCTDMVVVTKHLYRAFFFIVYIVNIAIVELMMSFLLSNLILLAMTVKKHGIKGKFAFIIKYRCTLTKLGIMLLIISNNSLTFKRSAIRGFFPQSNIYQGFTYMCLGWCRIHYIGFIYSACRQTLQKLGHLLRCKRQNFSIQRDSDVTISKHEVLSGLCYTGQFLNGIVNVGYTFLLNHAI